MIVLLNVYICALRKEIVPLLPGDIKIYTPGTIANSKTDREPTEINNKVIVIEAVFISNKLQSVELEQHSGKFHNYTV